MRNWGSRLGMVGLIVIGVLVIGAFMTFNRWYVRHRLEAQGYHVTDLSMAWINKHPFWCSGTVDSKGHHDSAPIYTFDYVDNMGNKGTGFTCEQGWMVMAWPNTDYSMFN